MPQSAFFARLLWITLAALLVVVAWQSLPLIQASLFSRYAAPVPVTPRGDLADDEKSTIALFESARGSVVFIATTSRMVDPWTRNALQRPRGTGSGFFWDNLGHIVTNNHVIAGASAATVRLADGRAFNASLVGASPAHDLAVLRVGVGAARPAPLPIGASADLRVGQKVFAIGNPFGLDWTLTTGIVSALDRDLPTEAGVTIQGLIQTDAAINPGNSGGPLLDSAGRLIGVNTAIYSPSGASAGIGFAVQVDVVNRVVPQLIARGRYVRPALGIRTEERMNAALAARLGVEGVFVLEVEPNSGAAAAGIRPARFSPAGEFAPGDVIVSIDDKTVKTVADFLAALERYEVGATVRVGLQRGGERASVPITLQGGGRGGGG